MTVEFVRFKATDDVELQGWLSNTEGNTAALHIHGRAGNGYENYFLDDLRQVYVRRGVSFFSIDTRGRGQMSEFRQGDGWKLAGGCYEIFDESLYDIRGALDHLRALGKTKFILQGHSMGCMKIVNYLVTQAPAGVEKVILIAPTDMTGWAEHHTTHQAYLTKAHQLLADGKGLALVDARCWLDETPLSAQTYPTICEAGSSADIYGSREGGALLGRVDIPVLITYGDADIGITQIDGTLDNWLQRVNKIKHPNTHIAQFPGAGHDFRGQEAQLAKTIEEFIT